MKIPTADVAIYSGKVVAVTRIEGGHDMPRGAIAVSVDAVPGLIAQLQAILADRA